jgi:chaperonin GroES
MTLKLKPIDDRIVITPLSPEEKTAGGVILPDTAQEKPNKGKVIAVGPGRMLDSGKRATPAVEAGAVVYFGKYAGTEVKVSGNEFKILRESDILAVEE